MQMERNRSSTSFNINNLASANSNSIGITREKNYPNRRNSRSLKILNIHLKEYKIEIKNHNQQQDPFLTNQSEKQQLAASKITMAKNNSIFRDSQPFATQKNENMTYKQNANLPNSRQKQQENEEALQNIKNFKFNAQDKEFRRKCIKLIENLLIQIGIFQKLFEKAKKKRTVISKLYGWDPIFNPVFFIQLNENVYSEQFRPNITQNSILSDLSLQRKSFSSQNIYNKLRLFLAQLIKANKKQQQNFSNHKREKLLIEVEKLRRTFDKLSGENKNEPRTSNSLKTDRSSKIISEIDLMRKTHLDMINMKLKIKNRGQQIQKLMKTTKKANLLPFYLQEQRNYEYIQSFVKTMIGK